MKNKWMVWFVVVGILITILIAFNYEGGRRAVPLSEIFPEEQAQPVEYEFFEADNKLASMIDDSRAKEPAQTPAPKVVEPKAVTAAAASAPASAAGSVAPASSTISPKSSSGAPVVSSAVAPKPQTTPTRTFTIQVASFKDKDKAEKALTQVKEKGYPAYIDPKSRQEGGFWYQICVGKFNVKQEANDLLGKIQQDYKDSFIKNLQNH